MSAQRYVIVIEGTPDTNYSAFAPDLPGCVATGRSVEQCEATMRQAIALHLEGLRAEGLQVPTPSAVTASVVEVS